jgi:hypothetical protein
MPLHVSVIGYLFVDSFRELVFAGNVGEFMCMLWPCMLRDVTSRVPEFFLAFNKIFAFARPVFFFSAIEDFCDDFPCSFKLPSHAVFDSSPPAPRHAARSGGVEQLAQLLRSCWGRGNLKPTPTAETHGM